MACGGKLWLVYNAASGGNCEAALAEVEAGLVAAGFDIVRQTCFPDEPAPDIRALDADGIDTLCVFAGDGTIHSVVAELFGWSGRILVLPGGTMNLLSRRVHGAAQPGEILARVAKGLATTVRPPVLESRLGPALTGALAGPGTEWNRVREAMRAPAVGEMAAAAAGAAAASIAGERVTCPVLPGAREDGYAAISITPEQGGVAVKGYYADALGDYVGQLTAMLQGDFRDGPHDSLGVRPEVEIASLDGSEMGLLLDGEQASGLGREIFRVAACGVDLIATARAA